MNTMPDRQIPIRVLVVEDQELIRESFEIILSNKPDIQVVGTASNGEEAVLLCEKLVPDIVLLDIRMPKMDGNGTHPVPNALLPGSPDPESFVLYGFRYLLFHLPQ